MFKRDACDSLEKQNVLLKLNWLFPSCSKPPWHGSWKLCEAQCVQEGKCCCMFEDMFLFLFFSACMFDEREKENVFHPFRQSIGCLESANVTCYKLSPVVQGILFDLFSSPQTILQLAALAFYDRTALGPQLYLFQTLFYCHFLDCNLQLHVSLNTVLLLIQVTRFSTIHQKTFLEGLLSLLYWNPTL